MAKGGSRTVRNVPWRPTNTGPRTPLRDPLSARALADARLGSALDATFYRLAHEVETKLALYARAPKIRIEAWLRKFCEQTDNITWKKNRNSHVRLLIEQLKRGHLDQPYDKHPDPGPLGSLPGWMKLGYGDLGSHRETSFVGYPGTSLNSAAYNPKYSVTRSVNQGAGTSRGSGGGGGGEPEYVGNYRRVDKKETIGLVAAAAASAATAAASHAVGMAPADLGAADAATATGAVLRKPRAEVEAQLGAARERALEMEWRLQVTEDKVRSQEQEIILLQKQLKAKDDEYANQLKRLKLQSAAEAEELIRKYERKRADWQEERPKIVYVEQAPPATIISVDPSPVRRAPKPRLDNDEFLEHLDKFRAKSAELRTKLFST